MQKLALEATQENISSTFQEDILKRNIDVAYFFALLNSFDDACTVALNGPWGSGKTFFVKQVKIILDYYNVYMIHAENVPEYMEKKIKEVISSIKLDKRDIIPQISVYYDAWENDNDDDPMMSLLYAIIQSTDNEYLFKNRNYTKIALAAIEMVTGKKISAFFDAIKGGTPFEKIIEQKKVAVLINEFLDELLFDHGKRLVVFVDELDRCKPDFAVSLLERVKHYFDHKNITFVFSVNLNQLQYTIKKHYGADFDAFGYLNRFFDLMIMLPSINVVEYYGTLTKYADNLEDMVVKVLIEQLQFNLRQIAKYIYLLRKINHNRYKNIMNRNAYEFCTCVVVPIAVALSIYSIKEYEEFVLGNNADRFLQVLKNEKIKIVDSFLNRDETYDNTSEKQHISVDDRLQSIYRALFLNNGDFLQQDHFGILEITSSIRKDLKITLSGLSCHMDFARSLPEQTS